MQLLPMINIVAHGILALVNYFLICGCGDKKYVNFKGILLVLLAVLLVMAGSFFLYQHNVIRYCVIAAIAVAVLAVAYKFRGVLIKLIKTKLGKKKQKNEKKTEE